MLTICKKRPEWTQRLGFRRACRAPLLLGQIIACHRLSGDSMTDSSRCPAQELLKAGRELLGGAIPGCSAQLDGVLSLCQKNYRSVGDG